MSTIMFLYNNLVDLAATTLTASSANVNYPLANVKNQLRSKTWQTQGATAGTANLVIDFASAKDVTAIALTGYDWTSAPGTLNMEFNATDSWGSPSVTKTLTWAASPTANGNKATIILTFASISYRYARLNVVYSPGAVPTDWNLGRLFLGEYFQPTANYNYGYQVNMFDPSLAMQTVGGQEYHDEIEKYREISFGATFAEQAQWELYQKMFNACGVSRDLFISFDYANEPDEMTIYGKFTSLPGAQDNRRFDISCVFKESR